MRNRSSRVGKGSACSSRSQTHQAAALLDVTPGGAPGVREQGTGRAVQIGQQEEGQDGDEHQAGAVNEETGDESGKGTCRGYIPHDEQSGSGGEWGVVHEAIHLDPRGRAGTDRQHRTCEQLQSAPTPRCGAPGDDGMWELSPSGTAHRASHQI